MGKSEFEGGLCPNRDIIVIELSHADDQATRSAVSTFPLRCYIPLLSEGLDKSKEVSSIPQH